MNPIQAIAAFALALLPQAHGAEGTQQAGDVDIVSGREDGNARMTVPVTIGSKGTYNFLVDTGSQNTVISSGLANRLAMQPTASATLLGVAGSQRVQTVELEEISLGRRSFYSISAPLLESRHVGADGIIGLDSLQNQRVLIDFARNLMAIGDAQSLGGNRGFEIVVTARRRSGQLIMTNARIDGVWTDVVIDTGAQTTIGNRALQKALEMRHTGNTAMLESVTGQQIEADIGQAEALDLGRIQINNVLLAFADAPPFKHLGLEKRPAILLGMRELRSFKRVAIDFSTRKILFDVPFGVSNLPEYMRAMTEGGGDRENPAKTF